jgi:hypothetical protein
MGACCSAKHSAATGDAPRRSLSRASSSAQLKQLQQQLLQSSVQHTDGTSSLALPEGEDAVDLLLNRWRHDEVTCLLLHLS